MASGCGDAHPGGGTNLAGDDRLALSVRLEHAPGRRVIVELEHLAEDVDHELLGRDVVVDQHDVDGVGLGQRRHVILIEDSTGVGELVSYTPNLRSVETIAKLLVANTTQSNTLVDVYILQAGETIEEDTLPFLNGLVIGLSPITIPMPEGDFDIYVTPDDDTVPLAGPVPITTAFGEVWQMLIYENVDPAVVDVVINQLP